MTIEFSAGSTAFTGESVKYFQMASLLAGLKLEVKGLKKKGESCYTKIRRDYGLRGNKQKVLEQFEALCLKARQEQKVVVK